MNYIGNLQLGQVARFLFNTTAGGAAASFDVSPDPSVVLYEDGSIVEISAGVTLTLDFDGRVGLHLVEVDTSGLSSGKDYILVLAAGEVSGLDRSGLVLGSLSVENRLGASAAEVWAYATRTLTSGVITVLSPVNAVGKLTLVRADDYLVDDDRALQFSSAAWPDLTSAEWVRLTVRDAEDDAVIFEIEDSEADRVVGVGSQTVVVEPTTADTASLVPGTGSGKYDLRAKLLDASIITLARGVVDVYEDQTRDLT